MDQIPPRESSRQHGNARKLDPLLPLKPRLERFAQGRALGLPPNEAYVLAGYVACSAKAYALDKKEHVRARIKYLVERRRAAAPGSPGASSRAGEILPSDDSETPMPELTHELVIRELYLNLQHAKTGTINASAANACNKALDMFGKQLGMWQTPYTPWLSPQEEESVLSGFPLDEAFAFLVKKLGHEKAAEIVAEFAPAGIAAPAPNGHGGNGSAPPAGTGAAKPNGKPPNGNGTGH